MKETLHSSDGSQYYGNGVWGPSAADLQRADLFSLRQTEIKEETNNHISPTLQKRSAGRFLEKMYKILPAKFVVPVGLSTILLAAACGSDNSEKTGV